MSERDDLPPRLDRPPRDARGAFAVWFRPTSEANAWNVLRSSRDWRNTLIGYIRAPHRGGTLVTVYTAEELS